MSKIGFFLYWCQAALVETLVRFQFFPVSNKCSYCVENDLNDIQRWIEKKNVASDTKWFIVKPSNKNQKQNIFLWMWIFFSYRPHTKLIHRFNICMEVGDVRNVREMRCVFKWEKKIGNISVGIVPPPLAVPHQHFHFQFIGCTLPCSV